MTPVTPSEQNMNRDDFDRSGYEGIVAAAAEPTCELYAVLFARSLASGDAIDEKTTAVLRLLAAVTSLQLREDSEGEPFGAAAFGYASRGWTIDDFTEPHLDLLAQAAPDVDDAELRARLADILWVRRRDFRMAVLAVRSYLESAGALEEAGSSFDHVDRLGRARNLAASLGRSQRDLYDEVLRRIGEAVDRVDEDDVDFRSVRLLEILAGSDPGDPEAWGRLSGRLAGRAEEQSRWRAARRLRELEAEFHGAAGLPEERRAARIKAAETHEKEAEDSLARTGGGYLAAAHHLKLAVEALRHIEGASDRTDELHARLLDYGRRGVEEMEASSVGTDLTELAEQTETHVGGKDVLDALLALASVILPTDADHLKREVERQFGQFLGMSLMPIRPINERGMTVGVTPSTAPEGASGRQLQVLAEMYSQVVQVHYPTRVHGIIEPAKRVILREHRVTADSFYALVAHNPMVPLGREFLFARGLNAWLYGDLPVAAHLLVPQLENSLRTLLERAGGRTTTLGPGGVQQDRTLGAVLSAERLEGILGSNVLFDLRCLLSESFGANLRNLLSHGLVGQAGMYSTPVSYLCWLILHLCAAPLLLRAQRERETEEEP